MDIVDHQQRTLAQLYSGLPDDVKLEIIDWTIVLLHKSLLSQVHHPQFTGTAAAAMFNNYLWAFGARLVRRAVLHRIYIDDTQHMASFLRKVVDTRQVATSVVEITLDGETMSLDWRAFANARKCMLNLQLLSLDDLVVSRQYVKSVTCGLKSLRMRRCQMTTRTLSYALRGVGSFEARWNVFTGPVDNIEGEFAFNKLVLASKSDNERDVYRRALCLVKAVTILDVDSMDEGWILGSDWSTVINFRCIDGPPAKWISHQALETLDVTLTTSQLTYLVPFLRGGSRATLHLSIDIVFGCRADNLEGMWQALDECQSQEVEVCFHIRDRTPDEDRVESLARTVDSIAASNIVGGVRLCRRAHIQVRRWNPTT
ncbi:hypothetical protein CYLTODRAFT_489607 [Cylindrobasidium torrendii FP15055 ss-10]|uniref:F-box domain-containing protein n=1 Tax=Cylindrobasidium torrendii FP15055 ss-10 TaxID=1314674 RepID=A0A0D7BG25_9AGAR|nr:hypothetical protein CYLTODRAFT_489607 [Cylindrobasidium torrendii FP15055 ss-10]